MRNLENNKFLERNLEFLKAISPWCKDAILASDVDSLDFCETQVREINLRREVGDQTLYFHSQEGAIHEAEKWFGKLSFTRATETFYVLGVGVGYAYFVAKEWLNGGKNRYLVFLEDDLALLKKFLSLEQAVEILAHPRVLLIPFHTPKEGKWIFCDEDFEMVIPLFADTVFRLVPSKHYADTRKILCERLHVYLQVKSADWLSDHSFYQEKYQDRYFQNFYINIQDLPQAKAPLLFDGAFQNIPAIVCGAGPSLQENIETLSQLADRAIIFGAGTGVNALSNNHLLPHFGAGVDPHPASASRIATNTAFELPYFYQNFFCSKALELIHGPKINCKGEDFFGVETWLYKELGLADLLPSTPTRVSTTYACVGLAQMMGCEPIMLAGVDLAITDKKRYSKGYQTHPLGAVEEKKTSSIFSRSQLVLFEVEPGKTVRTTGNWLREATAFARFAEANPGVTLINATGEGLLIPGVPSMPLQGVVQKYMKTPMDLLNWIHTEIEGSPLMPVTEKDLYHALEKWEKSMKMSVNILNQMINELLRARVTGARHSTYKSEALLRYRYELEGEIAYEHYLKKMAEKFEARTLRDRYLLIYRPQFFSEEEKGEKLHKLEFEKVTFLLKLASNHLELIDLGFEKSEYKNSMHKESDDEAFPLELAERDSVVAVGGQPLKRHQIHYPGGALKGEWHDANGELHGPSTFFAEDGALLARGNFVKGCREGKNVQYYHSGQVYSLQKFKKGALHGEQLYFYETGALKTEIHYSEGRLEGSVLLYYPNSHLKRELYFRHGELEGKELMWSEAGVCLLEAEYKQGAPVNVARMWDLNGTLRKEITFYDSSEHFDVFQWDGEGVLFEKKLYTPEQPDEIVEVRRSLANFNRKIDSSISKLQNLTDIPDELLGSSENRAEDLEKALKELKDQFNRLRSRFK